VPSPPTSCRHRLNRVRPSNSFAPEATATITLDDNLFDALRVEVDDGTLRVELAGGYSYTGVNLSAQVELPSLRGLELSSDS
jgi:hypothetical protein